MASNVLINIILKLVYSENLRVLELKIDIMIWIYMLWNLAAIASIMVRNVLPEVGGHWTLIEMPAVGTEHESLSSILFGLIPIYPRATIGFRFIILHTVVMPP